MGGGGREESIDGGERFFEGENVFGIGFEKPGL